MTVEELKALLESDGQILKTRDDHAPVLLNRPSDATGADQFTVPTDSTCSWAKPDETFGQEKLRPRIEPWLTALAQSEHLSLLVGSGLTHAVHGLVTKDALPGMGAVTFGVLSEEITTEAKRAANAVYSAPKLPPTPQQSCHPLHSKVATRSTAKLPLIPRQSCHP